MKNADLVLPAAFLDLIECAVDDVFGNGLFAVVHQDVHELGQDDVAELGVRQNLPFFGAATT